MNPSLQQYGSFNEAVSAGAVSMDMLDKAMQKAADGSSSATKTIRDTWSGFNEDLSQALIPTLEALTPVINALIDKMDDWGKGAGKTVSNVVKYFQDLFKQLQQNGAITQFSAIWDNLKSAFGSVIGIIGNLIKSFAGVDESTSKNSTSVENVANTISSLANKFADITKKLLTSLVKLVKVKAQWTQ